MNVSAQCRRLSKSIIITIFHLYFFCYLFSIHSAEVHHDLSFLWAIIVTVQCSHCSPILRARTKLSRADGISISVIVTGLEAWWRLDGGGLVLVAVSLFIMMCQLFLAGWCCWLSLHSYNWIIRDYTPARWPVSRADQQRTSRDPQFDHLNSFGNSLAVGQQPWPCLAFCRW